MNPFRRRKRPRKKKKKRVSFFYKTPKTFSRFSARHSLWIFPPSYRGGRGDLSAPSGGRLVGCDNPFSVRIMCSFSSPPLHATFPLHACCKLWPRSRKASTVEIWKKSCIEGPEYQGYSSTGGMNGRRRIENSCVYSLQSIRLAIHIGASELTGEKGKGLIRANIWRPIIRGYGRKEDAPRASAWMERKEGRRLGRSNQG